MEDDPPVAEWDENWQRHTESNVGYGHRWPVEAFEPLSLTTEENWRTHSSTVEQQDFKPRG